MVHRLIMFHVFTVICILLVVLSEAAGACTPCDCRGSTAYCDRRRLTDIPQGLPTTLTHLRLKYNKISSLNTTRLEQFSLLTHLYLENNTLTNFYVTSSQLPNLRYLYLDANSNLHTVNVNSFTLRLLSLKNTAINDIPERLPTSLHHLHLSNNNIPSLNMTRLEGLNSLTELLLDNTSLTSFHLKSDQLRSLWHLDLSSNTRLRTIIIDSSSIGFLSLKKTAISCVSNNNLQATNLEYLLMDNSAITILDITHLIKISSLWLWGTSLDKIHFNHTTLQQNSFTISSSRNSFNCSTCCLLEFLRLFGDVNSCKQYNETIGDVQGLDCHNFDVVSCEGNGQACKGE